MNSGNNGGPHRRRDLPRNFSQVDLRRRHPFGQSVPDCGALAAPSPGRSFSAAVSGLFSSVAKNQSAIVPGNSVCTANISAPCPPDAKCANRLAEFGERLKYHCICNTCGPNTSSSAADVNIGMFFDDCRNRRPSRSVGPASRTSDFTSGCRRANWIALLTPQLAPPAPTRVALYARLSRADTGTRPQHRPARFRFRLCFPARVSTCRAEFRRSRRNHDSRR